MFARCIAIAVIVGGCGRLAFDPIDAPPIEECTPVTVANGVGAGGDYTCALVAGGITCWGDGSEGQLADGTNTSRIAPQTIPLGTVTAFSTGTAHACAVADTGLVCWGRNQSGQLGLAHYDPRSSPTQVPTAPTSIAGVAAGGQGTCVWTDGGELWCWGSRNGVNTGSNVPLRVAGVPSIVDAALSSYDALFSATHGCAVGRDGSVWCWGLNDKGQLGDNTTSLAITPVQVVGMSNAIRVAVGLKVSCAIVAGGDVYCWGANSHGQLGNGTRTDSLVARRANISNAVAIAAKHETVCARLEDATVWCWGSNESGQLGTTDVAFVDMPQPVNVPSAAAIAVGASHACVLTQKGGVWCWGSDRAGERGDSNVDRAVLFDVGFDSQRIASGDDFTCAMLGREHEWPAR
jgi:alpha-tubulin suppressor-like RCC1 family protein